MMWPYRLNIRGKPLSQISSSATALAAAVLSLAGCTFSGGDIGNPAVRKLHWFSFVAGDDIRQACASDTPDRFRVVYNGVYERQVRVYETDSLRQQLAVWISEPGSVSSLYGGDLLAPWRAKVAKVALDQAGYDRLLAAFADSAMFAPPPVGLELPSHGYSWTAAFCRGGHFGFTGWRYPSTAFDDLSFPAQLFALDPTGIPVAEAAPLPIDPLWEDKSRRGEAVSFSLKVGQDGMLR